MAILVLRCQKLGHSMHHRDPGSVPAADWSHNFAKNHRLDLKLSCIDASQRQLQSGREFMVQTIFLIKLWRQSAADNYFCLLIN